MARRQQASDQDQYKLGQDQHNVVRLGLDAVTDGLILQSRTVRGLKLASLQGNLKGDRPVTSKLVDTVYWNSLFQLPLGVTIGLRGTYAR
jgi:hypothetical protein